VVVALGRKLAEKLIPVVRDPAGAAGQGRDLSSLLDYVTRWR
jgi:hypothetical protein